MTTMPGVLIGVDVGCTTISGGLVTADGAILSTVQVPTRLGSRAAMEGLLGVVATLRTQAAERALHVEAVGVGLPGLVDTDRGVLLTSAGDHVVDLCGNIAERLEAKTGLPTLVDNDANALALGEWRFGLARGSASCVVLAIGTGIGAGLIMDGRLARGHRGYAGELGHIPLELDGPPCPCGGRGCVAMYAAGEYLAEQARRRVAVEPSSMPALAGSVDAITARTIFDAAAAGDGLARAMADRACQALGATLAIVVNGLNPEIVIVTGGVVSSLLPLEDEILRRTRQYALADALASTRIHLVPGDKTRTVRGGAALVLYERARRAPRAPGAMAAGEALEPRRERQPCS
ncbi:MAG: ROK family protein [Candidatus Rokuibacteriota bacterium]